MNKIKIFMCDTETAGSLDNPLVYDIGAMVLDAKGNQVMNDTINHINCGVFYFKKDLMETAYYAAKLPSYRDEIWDGERLPAKPDIRARLPFLSFPADVGLQQPDHGLHFGIAKVDPGQLALRLQIRHPPSSLLHPRRPVGALPCQSGRFCPVLKMNVA